MAVVSTDELVAAFRAALQAPVISHPPGTAGYDLYEVYLYGLAVEAARNTGMDVSFEDSNGSPAARLVLRSSPSSIFSPAQPFTHATLTKGNDRLEAHLGIYLRGTSGVSHEGDVVILDATEAATARARRVDPRADKAIVVIEAKFHAADVRLRFGREFLGLAKDIPGERAIFVSSSPGPKVQKLLKGNRPGHFEVTPGSNQDGYLSSKISHRLETYLS